MNPIAPVAPGSSEQNQSCAPEMLQRVWQELDYRIDVCRLTKCSHIEVL
jgi:putative ribosome biogenesis GTPase RsgA